MCDSSPYLGASLFEATLVLVAWGNQKEHRSSHSKKTSHPLSLTQGGLINIQFDPEVLGNVVRVTKIFYHFRWLPTHGRPFGLLDQAHPEGWEHERGLGALGGAIFEAEISKAKEKGCLTKFPEWYWRAKPSLSFPD